MNVFISHLITVSKAGESKTMYQAYVTDEGMVVVVVNVSEVGEKGCQMTFSLPWGTIYGVYMAKFGKKGGEKNGKAS